MFKKKKVLLGGGVFVTFFTHDEFASLENILICWFAAQETFLIIINVEKNCAAS